MTMSKETDRSEEPYAELKNSNDHLLRVALDNGDRANRFEQHLRRMAHLWNTYNKDGVYPDLALTRLGEMLDLEFTAAEKSLKELGVAQPLKMERAHKWEE